ncbi:Phosphatidylinositol-glycan biosynthesis class W protein [Strongyloides ratti]|uniref:Phosphatidylinositol-glycan biosynthesis class W protein n=1 Tax=Strongyloides ratti TaxID=34506 RepID=A0A090MY78_STRRB|nr:Phosphatidylinositol-glycan biosynthesis class W protein [Strongyloides ratti]CEF66709.1 Phosphatidylinositol-glycan biosynthesis class W protein [Strongyloides ratti]
MDKNRLHEEFVSGGVGDYPWIVPIQGICGGIFILFNYQIIQIFNLKLNGFSQILYNFFFIVIPYIFLMTIFSKYVLEIFVILSTTILLLQFFYPSQRENKKEDDNITFYFPEFDCLRSCILIPTAIAILAVDFKIFPRSWGKTEYYGYSVMDVGTSGSFMIMGIGDEIVYQKRQLSNTVQSKKKLLKSLPSWLILFILGIIRMIFVSIFNYHSHVSEYGVHWNFFITMGCVALLSKLFSKYISIKMLTICLVLNYILLNLCGLQEWGLNNDILRTNIISSNKEGIISILGYFTLKKSKNNTDLMCIAKTLLAPILFFSLQLIAENFLGEPSRRVYNIPFFFYTAGTTSLWFSLMMYGAYSSEKLRNLKNNNDLLYLLSKYGLYFFLLANLLTVMSNLYNKDEPFDSEANAKKQLYSMRKDISSTIGEIHNKQKIDKKRNTLYCDIKGDELTKLEEDSFVPGTFRSSRDDKEKKDQVAKEFPFPIINDKQKDHFLGNVYFAETTNERKEKWLNILQQRRIDNK